MKKTINILRYKELMELARTCNNSFSKDQFNEFNELMFFRAAVERQVFYNRREEYLLLMDKYFNKEINSYEFRRLFEIMQVEDSVNASRIYNDLQALETFELDTDPLKISNLITEIANLCTDFEAISLETRDDIAKSKLQFYSSLKKHYLKLQKLLALSSKKNLDYDKLVFRSFNMLKQVIASEILLILLYIIIIK